MILWLLMLAQYMTIANNIHPIYYVANSSYFIENSSCIMEEAVLHPCVTLEVMAENLTHHSNISILYFIHEDYFIYDKLNFSFTALALSEWKPWKERSEVNIFCKGDLSLMYTEVKDFKMEWITFHDCGKSMPVITFHEDSKTSVIKIANTAFIKSRKASLKVLCDVESFEVTNCIFDGGEESYGVYITSGYIHASHFIKSVFINNAAGSIFYSSKSTLINFISCAFVNNTIKKKKTGSSIFVKSFANIYIEKSKFSL